jgi:membrane-associated phospholipid phosphatase
MNERPWARALGWLLFLGPFFFITYNFANYMASRRLFVPVVMFPWERNIPFIPWTIVPYWSSDLFYAISLFICRTRNELDLHGKRLLAIQVVCVACFLAFPLRCSNPAPSISGWERGWFAALQSFDRPFNQAPSLHVALALILWVRFRGALRIALAPWFVLMAFSTLTTHQHHFIDVPTGAWAGLLVLAALPERRREAPHIRLALCYLAGAILFVAAGFCFWWPFFWPGFALSMVAAAYWSTNPRWLRLGPLMLPYTAAAWINSRCWTRGEPAKCHVADGVWLGRAPLPWERNGIESVVDLAPELQLRANAYIPILDLTIPTTSQLDSAVESILRLPRPILVCCALGYSRSATVSAAWLLKTKAALSVDEAVSEIERLRPRVVISEAHRKRLTEWMANAN